MPHALGGKLSLHDTHLRIEPIPDRFARVSDVFDHYTNECLAAAQRAHQNL